MAAQAGPALHNTWLFGLERLLLGYATSSPVAGPEAWQGIWPQPGLAGLDSPLASQLLQWLEATRWALDWLQHPHTPTDWAQGLHTLVDRFMKATDDAEARELSQLLQPLHDWLQACQDARLAEPLPLVVVREHWLSQLQGASLHQRFFGGGVQFATLMPMRSIPFRVVALLGMNDGAYPRQTSPRQFDLMTRHWRAGDRSRREDDRYLFLEALLSARERFYISWQGRRPTDNAELPPSVLVAQLLEHVQQQWGHDLTPRLQPLQPFSLRYFQKDSGFQTFDADWARLHRSPDAALQIEPSPDQPPLAAPRPAPESMPGAGEAGAPLALSLAQLERLLRQPVEVFFHERLHLRLEAPPEEDTDDEPFALDALQQHVLAQGLLNLSDEARPAAGQALLLTGKLPLGGFGQMAARGLQQKAQAVAQRRAHWLQRFDRLLAPRPVALAWTAPTDAAAVAVQLTGSLPPLWADSCSDSLLQLEARPGAITAKLQKTVVPLAHPLVKLWVRHLAGCASGLNLTSVLLGADAEVRLLPMPAEEALAELVALVPVWLQARQAPLPVACKTGWQWLMFMRLKPVDVDGESGAENSIQASAEAEKTFEFQSQKAPGERSSSPALQRAFARYADLAAGLPLWAPRLYARLADHAQVEKGEA
jgi:exodeoxyribonuclease V gamma subunit